MRFDVDQTMGLKVPHMGWNQLDVRRPSPLFKGLPRGSRRLLRPRLPRRAGRTELDVVATTTDYGRPFVSSVWRDNVFATQFHPEKSQKVGLHILANFAAM